MAVQCFQTFLDFVWLPNNDGQPYHSTVGDPGKGTAWGITAASWAAAVHLGLVKGTLQAAKQSDCGVILRSMYWQIVLGDELPAGVDIAVANMAMVAGPGAAARIAQREVGAEVDGQLGRLTLAAIQKHSSCQLIEALTAGDIAYFGDLVDSALFKKGWDRRALDCQAIALKAAGGGSPPSAAPAAPVPAPKPPAGPNAADTDPADLLDQQDNPTLSLGAVS